MNAVIQKLVNNSTGFQGNLLPFCAKLKLLHIVPSEQSFQKTFMDYLVVKMVWEEEGGATHDSDTEKILISNKFEMFSHP